MKICVENLDAIIEKYRPLILSTLNRFPNFERNEAYINACDFVLDVVEDFDESRGKFGGYLKYRLYYHFLNMTRMERITSLNSVDKNGLELIERIEDDVDIEKNLIRDFERLSLLRAMKKLSARERELIFLKYDKNLSHKEIGEVLNISAKTVTNKHGLILDKLRRLLIKEEVY